MQARFLSRIPFPEDLALQQAPFRWDLGEGAGRIQLSVALFSFARHRVWERATQAIKLSVRSEDSVGRHSVGDLLTTPQGREAMVVTLEEALLDFRTQWGVLPVDFADMIAAVSDPVDLDASWRAMEDWAASAGLDLRRSEGPNAWREAFSEILQHVLPIRDAVRLVVDIAKINTEVKKNITADQATDGSGPAMSPRRKLSQRLQRMSMALHQRKPSPASPS